jgi:hypothetical protein
LGYAWKSVVYHKEGRSIGGRINQQKSVISEFYSLKNRILFTKKFYKRYLPIVCVTFIFILFNRIRRREWKYISIVFRAFFKGIFE